MDYPVLALYLAVIPFSNVQIIYGMAVSLPIRARPCEERMSGTA